MVYRGGWRTLDPQPQCSTLQPRPSALTTTLPPPPGVPIPQAPSRRPPELSRIRVWSIGQPGGVTDAAVYERGQGDQAAKEEGTKEESQQVDDSSSVTL